jgi:hypothetical protein
MFQKSKTMFSVLAIACALFACAPSAYAQTSNGCDAEVSRIELELDTLEADAFEAISEAERRASRCAADLAASDAVKRTLDVRLADYEAAFADERALRATADERARSARASRVVWAVGGAAVATAVAVVLAVLF